MTGAATKNFLPLWGVPVLPLGNVASVLYVGAMAVTIARHHLLDVRVLFRTGMLYSSLTFVLAALSIAVVLGLQVWFQAEVFAGSVVLPMLPAIAVGIAAGPLKAALQERLDRTFFRSRSEMRTRLAEFSAVLGRLEREEHIWRAAWEEGWRWAHPERGVVLLGREGALVPLREQGTSGPERASAAEILGAGGGVRRLPAGAPFEVVVPVAGRVGLLGGAVVGAKASGEPSSAEDLAFLEGIAGQAALAVERVRLAERVGRDERLAALGRAAGVIAHELRNPLNVMRGASALLRRHVGAGPGSEGLGLLKTGLPVVLDTLHHACNNNGEPIEEAIFRAGATWCRQDGPPIIDFSTQEKGRRMVDPCADNRPPDFQNIPVLYPVPSWEGA